MMLNGVVEDRQCAQLTSFLTIKQRDETYNQTLLYNIQGETFTTIPTEMKLQSQAQMII